MVDASDGDYPTFAEAEARFREFVRSQGLDDQIVHASHDDLALFHGMWFTRRIDATRTRIRACKTYDQAVRSRHGVSFTGHCVLNGAIVVHVYGPINDDEAKRLMYPNGLKLSIGRNLPAAQPVGALRWWLLRGRQWLDPAKRQQQTELLK